MSNLDLALGFLAGTAVGVHFLKDKAYGDFFTLAYQSALSIAKLEISDTEKRKQFEDEVYTLIPARVKLLVPKATMTNVMEMLFTEILAS